MKTNKVLMTAVTSVIFGIVIQSAAQQPLLKLNPGMQLQIFGHTNNFYQVESSTNMVSWSLRGTNFSLTNVSYSQTVGGTGKKQEFFRARALVSADNWTYYTPCAEVDNVIVFLRGDTFTYYIKATHPTYTVTDYTLWSVDCSDNHTYTNYIFTPTVVSMYDNHKGTNNVVWVYSDANFWRPNGMTVTIDGNNATKQANIQRIVLSRYIPASSGEYPQFLIVYFDGNMRLIPFPPAGHSNVSYGSSVIAGPTDLAYSIDGQELRPVCEITSIDYRTSKEQLFVTYKNGGTATLDIVSVTRTASVVKVTVNYPTDRPVCALRSNFVNLNTNDTSTLVWNDLQDVMHTNTITDYTNAVGKSWFFTRLVPSVTRNSAPDIQISFTNNF